MLHWEMSCGSVVVVKLMGLPLVSPSANFETKPQDTWFGGRFGVASLLPPPQLVIKKVIKSRAEVKKGDLIQCSAGY